MRNKIILVSIFCALFVMQNFAQTDDSMKSGKMPTKMAKMVTAEEAQKTALNVGAKIPSFTLINEKNEKVSSESLLKDGNLVLVFYRGAWCPYCNLYLKNLLLRLLLQKLVLLQV